MFIQLALVPALLASPAPQATTLSVPATAPSVAAATTTANANGTPRPGNIVEVATNNGNFTTLVAALQATGLDAALDGSQSEERFTVFAPTDAAFAALPPGATVPELLLDLPRLSDILLYHVAEGGLLSGNVLAVPTLDTLNGQRVDVSLTNGIPFIDQSQLIITDLLTSNGVIHVIDRVLIPNEATLVETAAGAPDAAYLSHLLEFLPALEQTLDASDFTVFAPSNAAFQQIPGAALRSLVLAPNLPTLESILAVHVVPGRLFADDVIAAGQLTSVGGKVLPVTVQGGSVFIDGALIVLTDVETANGNIHFIDTVLMPMP